MRKSILILVLLFSFTFHGTLSQVANAPKDGGGIKWSTLKKCVTKVELENGEKAEFPVIWYPYGPTARGVCAFGYEVDLEKEVTVGGVKKSKIKVWVFPKEPPRVTSDPNKEIWKDIKYWCHGWTFDDTTYSPGGSELPFILAAGWDKYNWTQNMKKGDIIVYYVGGSVAHSAISNGNGTFTSKDRFLPRNDKQTKAAMDKQYGNQATSECYRKKLAKKED